MKQALFQMVLGFSYGISVSLCIAVVIALVFKFTKG